MDSMEWFLGSVAVLTAVLLVGLDTVRSLQRYRVRLGRLLKNLTLTERIEIDLGAWLAVTVILGMNTWYFNESDVGMMAALLLAYIVCDVLTVCLWDGGFCGKPGSLSALIPELCPNCEEPFAIFPLFCP